MARNRCAFQPNGGGGSRKTIAGRTGEGFGQSAVSFELDQPNTCTASHLRIDIELDILSREYEGAICSRISRCLSDLVG